MNCTECQEQLQDQRDGAARTCALCRREHALYSAYAASIEPPELWPAIAARLAAAHRATPCRRSQSWRMPLAAAATIAFVLAGVVAIRQSRESSAPPAADPVTIAAAHYEAAIARLEPAIQSRASSPDAAGTLALLPQLSDAIRVARQEASSAPDDPAAATMLIAAYDAKLQVLRSITYEQ